MSASNLGTGNLTLTTSGTGSITQSGAATGNALTLNTASGNANFSSFDNNFNTLTGTSTSTGTIAYRDDNGFDVGTNNRGMANLTLQSTTGNITQSSAVSGNTLNVQTTSGNVILTNAGNNISTLQANSTSGNVSYTEANNQNFALGNSALGTGNLNLNALGTGSITQSGTASGNALTLTLNSGNANINIADFATLTGSSNGGSLSFADADGLILNSLNLGNGIANIKVGTGVLVTNGIVESNLDLAGNLMVGSATLTANQGNIIQLSGLISSTGNLNLSTNGGNAIINNSDVISLSGNTAGGNLTYADTDGVILGSLSAGAGDLTISTGSGSLANNFISENSLSVLGSVGGGNITLSSLILGANFNLNTSTIKAIDSLILNSNGNINGTNLFRFPKLIAPNVQISARGLIGSSNSPIGIQTAGLLPTSFINDQGRGVFLSYADILDLEQDTYFRFNLYPIYNPIIINTIALQSSIYDLEHKFPNSLFREESNHGSRILIIDETKIQEPYDVLYEEENNGMTEEEREPHASKNN